jgi:SAM-dependent methyltransferase
MMSETSKHRPLTVPFCQGNGIDLGSGGDPVVPWAISVDLPPDDFHRYNAGSEGWGTIHWRGDARSLPFKDGTLDFVYSSHLLEDFHDWWPVLEEWARVLKPEGHLVILVPDRERWAAAIARGQPPNCEHRHESFPGELTGYCGRLGLHPVMDRFAIPEDPGDYSVVFVGRKL